MRLVALILAIILATPALAQGWSHYDNPQYGYSAPIPPEFSSLGKTNGGEGATFDVMSKAQVLSFWAEPMDGDFEQTVAARIGYAERDGWNMAAQTITPNWASFSGVLGQRMFYSHLIALCGSKNYAVLTLQYSAMQAADMLPVIDRLANAFRATGC